MKAVKLQLLVWGREGYIREKHIFIAKQEKTFKASCPQDVNERVKEAFGGGLCQTMTITLAWTPRPQRENKGSDLKRRVRFLIS